MGAVWTIKEVTRHGRFALKEAGLHALFSNVTGLDAIPSFGLLRNLSSDSRVKLGKESKPLQEQQQEVNGEDAFLSMQQRQRGGRLWWAKLKDSLFGDGTRVSRVWGEEAGDGKRLGARGDNSWQGATGCGIGGRRKEAEKESGGERGLEEEQRQRQKRQKEGNEALAKDRLLKAVQLQGREPCSAFIVAMRRSELSTETGLALRDLRPIDPSFHNQIPTILPRAASIVVNLVHVKAVITANRVYVFNFTDDRVWKRLLPQLQMRLMAHYQESCATAAARAKPPGAPKAPPCSPKATSPVPGGGGPQQQSTSNTNSTSSSSAAELAGEGGEGPAGPAGSLRRGLFTQQQEAEERGEKCCEGGRMEDGGFLPQTSSEDGDAEEEIVREQGPFLADEDGERVAAGEPKPIGPHAGEVPFEFRMLETMLESADKALWERFMATVPDTLEILKRFVKDNGKEVLIEDQRHLLILRNRLLRFGMEVGQIRAAFHELLATDEDMAEMYLTRKALSGKPVHKDQHSEVEELLEDYYRRVEEVANEVQTLLTTIDVTGEYVRTVLDSSRNRLIRMDVMINMATCSIAAGGTMTGIFGMNLISTLENNPYAFAIATSSVFTISTVAFWALLRYAKKRRIM